MIEKTKEFYNNLKQKDIDILDEDITDAEVQEFYNRCWKESAPIRDRFQKELSKLPPPPGPRWRIPMPYPTRMGNGIKIWYNWSSDQLFGDLYEGKEIVLDYLNKEIQ